MNKQAYTEGFIAGLKMAQAIPQPMQPINSLGDMFAKWNSIRAQQQQQAQPVQTGTTAGTIQGIQPQQNATIPNQVQAAKPTGTVYNNNTQTLPKQTKPTVASYSPTPKI